MQKQEPDTRTMQYTPTSETRFSRALERYVENNPEYAPFLTTDRDFSDANCFLDSWGKSGFAITDDNSTTGREIIALFNEWDTDLGDQLVFEALKRGGRWLNCFSGYLGSFYHEHGFETVAYLEWDDDKAPEGWDYETYGRPDVLFMAFNPYDGRVNEAVTWDSAAEIANVRARDP